MKNQISNSLKQETGHVTGSTALCAAIQIADGGDAPEWIHLLPSGDIMTLDDRGPYRVGDMAALAAASLTKGDKLIIDENHSTDLAAPKGGSAPARGWIVELEARENGLWGKVEWTDEGKSLVVGKEYRGVSPVVGLNTQNQILSVLRASLVNVPNLRGLTALHSKENNMDFMGKLREALVLGEDASEIDVLAAIKKGSSALQSAEKAKAVAQTSLQAAETAKVTAETALQNAQLSNAGDDSQEVTELRAELTTVTTTLNSVVGDRKKEKATLFVDAAIEAKRVGVKASRDRFITLHMSDPEGAEAIINAQPMLGDSGTTIAPPANADGSTSLNAAQSQAAKLLGISTEDYKKTLDVERQKAGEAI